MDLPPSMLKKALKKATEAYGESVLNDLKKVLSKLESKPNLLEENMAKMAMTMPQAIVWQKLKKLTCLTQANES